MNVDFIDKNGAITRDEKLSVKKLPVWTDAKTLETLMVAAKAAGKRLKAREDHDDSIGARAGYFDSFKRISDATGDRVGADMHIFKSYRNRAVMLETAAETPEQIGLSIDMTPSFELAGDRALMRIEQLHAVDIVDEGAITPGGLFLSAGVDTEKKSVRTHTAATQPTETMASPTIDEVMSAVSALAKSMTECQAAIAKMAAPVLPKEEILNIVREGTATLAADFKTQGEQLKQVVADNAKLKRERALLGIRGTTITVSPTATAEEIETMTAGKKNYLQMVDEAHKAANGKLSRVSAGEQVRRTDAGKAAYAEHLASKGVTGRQTMAA